MIQHISREQVQSLILKERFHNPKEMQDFLMYIGRNLVNMCGNAILRVLDQRK